MKTGFFTFGHLVLLLSLSFGMTACNESEFYEKESLISNIDGPNGEADSGVDGGETSGSSDGGAEGGVDGGVAGGVDGGVDGGTTVGSSGGSSGGDSGGSSGGSSGSTAGGSYAGITENFMQSASQTKKLDIVWVIDDSGSMSDEQDALGRNFSAFIDDFITKDVDFKMGITTTDTRSGYNGVMKAGSEEKLTSAKAKENEAQFKLDFKNLVKVGTKGSGNERGLQASKDFMDRYVSSFVRPDAYLAIVIVSDEEDQSSGSVQTFTDALKQHKNSAGLVKVYTIADVNNTNYGSGITVGAERYIAAAEQTAGVAANIRDDFHTVLTGMGETIINLLDSFALAHQPVPGTLKVYVNGALTTAYTFDSASRSIKFNANSVPAAGAEIKVTYSK